MTGLGIFLVAASIYVLGFYRHWSIDYGIAGSDWLGIAGQLVLPVAALAVGVAGLVAGLCRSGSMSVRLRFYLALLLAAVLVTGAAAMAIDMGLLPSGEAVAFWQFGWTEYYSVASLLVSAASWGLWFALAVWCLGYGTVTGRRTFVNLGVIGVGLGVITRFFDLMSGLATTGWIFLIGGLVLLGTGWAMERWRRYLLGKMEKPE
jgi:hypothetical protein